MSVVTESINQANAEARYLSLSEIESFAKSGIRRSHIAYVLTESRECIVQQAGDQLFQRCSDVISLGGNAYGEEMTATCLRDLDYFLRLVTYGVISGDDTRIEDILVGLREMYNSLGTPIPAVAEGVRAMKNVVSNFLSEEEMAEAILYFDYVINALSQMESSSVVKSEPQFASSARNTSNSVRKTLRRRSREARLREMLPKHRDMYEQITKLRNQIGPVDFDVVEALRELRGNA